MSREPAAMIPVHAAADASTSTAFIPWFVYELVDDPHDPERVAHAPNESLTALFLQRHGDRLSPTERAFTRVVTVDDIDLSSALHSVLGVRSPEPARTGIG